MENGSKPEIIFAWEFWEWGGGQIYSLGIMRGAVADGYRVKAVMPAGSSEKLLGYLRQAKVETDFFPSRVDLSPAQNFWHKIRRRLRDARCRFILVRHLNRNGLKGKILQIETPPWSAFLMLFYLALRTHVFVPLHIATPFNPKSLNDNLTRLKYHILCRLPKFHIVASNEDMKNSLRPFLPENFWRQIPIAYTGVNTTEIRTALSIPFERDELLAKFDLPDNKLLVFSLANIIERKGFRVLLQAAKQLSEKRNDLFFVWIGDGDKRDEMLSVIKQLGLEKSFKIIRPADFGGQRQDLLQLLRLADIFVHPSFAEGLPGAMLEAMALGKPVVASRVNAIPECVIDGENGFLVEAGNAEGFAKAVEKLANDKELRRNFAEKAQKRVLEHFTEENCADVTIDFYSNCLKNKVR